MDVIEIAKNIGLFMTGVVIAYTTCRTELKKYFNSQKHKVSDKLPKQSAIDVKIVERLDYVKELLNADIIHIYEFHNGEHYADGRSALKFSCTYETTRASVESIRKNCTSLPIACMPKFVDTILNKGKFVCSNIEDIKESNPSTYDFKKSNNINSFADYAIKNRRDQVVGFVAVIWKDKNKFNNNQREIEKLTYFIEENLINNIEE